jgi:hypothetical protein
MPVVTLPDQSKMSVRDVLLPGWLLTVVETNRVTVRWVRDCCDSGKMLPMKYAALLYRPVPYILPIAAMQHIRCVTCRA